uniref:Uncharacterized protein n=1 Tax=Anguilla anguilla TaxID=7936 RepID=A0A0E9XF95_ANGAN
MKVKACQGAVGTSPAELHLLNCPPTHGHHISTVSSFRFPCLKKKRKQKYFSYIMYILQR